MSAGGVRASALPSDAAAARILLIGEEHVREKIARHYELLGRIGGFETHYYVDDRSGITAATQQSRPMPTVHRAPDPSRGVRAMLAYWVEFVRCFERVRPDILEVYTAIHFIVVLPMVWYAALRGVPRVVVCRGELYPRIYDAASPLWRWALRAILRAANLIVFKEVYMDEMLARLCPRTPRISWTNAIPVKPEPVYERDGNVVLFLNFFKDWRNIDVVARAAPVVRAAVPDVEFELVGGTDTLADRSAFYAELQRYEQTILALIEKVGASAYVRVRPFTSEVDPYYARAKVYVLPADLVFCNYALLEAMERGVPPVVSADRDPDARRMVEHEVSGVIAAIDPVALAEAIVGLLVDERRRQRLARGARAAVLARYDLDALLHGLVGRYQRLLRRRGTRAAAQPEHKIVPGAV